MSHTCGEINYQIFLFRQILDKLIHLYYDKVLGKLNLEIGAIEMGYWHLFEDHGKNFILVFVEIPVDTLFRFVDK